MLRAWVQDQRPQALDAGAGSRAGTGDVFDVKRAVPMPPGSFMVHPARAPHWDGSAGDEPVIVQIVGEGPGTTTQLDPKQPFWIEVSR